ncbi:MAG TPA: methyltransferase domain-containing protein [Candidatus Binatia bacterium]|nr:methyltransferase domain-containing protein [Candidatus Binatia bacterium]
MMETREEAARRIFGERAATYSTSTAHTDPQVLARVVELASAHPHWSVLDIATGTGHTAFALAPFVHSVVGTDLTPEMLAEAERLRVVRGIENVRFRPADVHHLPFEAETFDLVTCRRAAHHFSDIAVALCEMHRVVRRHGRLVIDDRSVPEDDFVDTCLNQLDRYHDESHVRQYRVSEWRTLLTTAGFAVEAVESYRKHRPLSAFTAGVAPQNVARIEALLAKLTNAERAALNLDEIDGETHLDHYYVLIAATKH